MSPKLFTPIEAKSLPASHRWQKKQIRSIIMHLMTLGIILSLAVITLFHLPNYLSLKLMKEYISERSLDWVDEMSEIGLPSQATFHNKTAPSNEDEIWIRYLARAGGIAQVSLISLNFRTFWSTDIANVSKMLSPEQISQLTNTSQNGNPVVKNSLASPQMMSLKTHLVTGVDPSKETPIPTKSGEYHRLSEVIVPYKTDEAKLGYIYLRYDIDQGYNWYKQNIETATIIIYSFAFFTVFISLLMNIVIKTRIGRMVRINEEKNLSLELAEKVKMHEMSSMQEFSEWLQSSRSLNEYKFLLKNFISQLFPNYFGSLYIFDENRQNLILSGAWGKDEIQYDNIIPGDSCWALRRGRPYHYGNQKINLRCNHNDVESCQQYGCLPIIANGEALGTLTLTPKDKNLGVEIFEKDMELAAKCVEQISMTLSNITLRDRLEEQTIIDPLTSLYNRRGFYLHLNKMLTLHRSGFMIALIDLDHFKRFNDQYGHDAGDEVLINVSTLLKEITNKSAYRLGGEEMAFFYATKDTEEANRYIENIREKISELVIRCNGKELPKVTASIGVAAYPSDTHKIEELLKIADTALYAAKEKGRNCVVWNKDMAQS